MILASFDIVLYPLVSLLLQLFGMSYKFLIACYLKAFALQKGRSFQTYLTQIRDNILVQLLFKYFNMSLNKPTIPKEKRRGTEQRSLLYLVLPFY